MPTVLIAGVGLIGGSLGLALRQRGLAQVLGHGRDPQRLRLAAAQGVIDEVVDDLSGAVARADVVLLGVPIGSMRAAMDLVAPALRADTLLLDVGSTKCSVLADARAVWGEAPANFVPAHPLAGSERSGFEHASATLFEDRAVVLTPVPETQPRAVERAREFWCAIGARVQVMTPDAHDRALAATSHLPHLAAYALAGSLGQRCDAAQLAALAAGSLRDGTRVALSDPALWRDIALANAGPLREALAAYRAALEQMDLALTAADGAALEAQFRAGQAARQALRIP